MIVFQFDCSVDYPVSYDSNQIISSAILYYICLLLLDCQILQPFSLPF